MSWECIRFPSAIPYRDGLGRLLGSFLREFFASGTPEGMALFKLRHGDSNGETVVYFTPVAAKLCRAELGDLSFETCDAPQRSLVSMIAGHMSARDLLVDP